MLSQNIPAITQVDLFSSGFRLVGVTNTSFSVSAGVCRDSNNVMDIVIGSPSAIGPTTTAPIILDATKNGINGLDTGSLTTNAMYNLYVIGDSSGYHAPATILCLDGSTPIMPAGYDSKRFQCYISTDGSSHFVSFVQTGNGTDKQFFYLSAPAILSGGNVASPTVIFFPTGLVPGNYLSSNLTFDAQYSILPAAAGNVLTVGNVLFVSGQVAAIPNYAYINQYVGYIGNTAALQYQVTSTSDSATIRLNSFGFSI